MFARFLALLANYKTRSRPSRRVRISTNGISRHGISSRQRPRGIAVVMVLGLLTITLAISYATLRGQGTTGELARNNGRAKDARVAAQSGLAAALRKMSENSWGGISSTLQSNVSNQSWYRVAFTTGDAKLTSSDPLYSEYPYRVTIESTGYSSDPLNAAIQSHHKSRCVVQLVRKKITTEPSGWTTLTSFNVYQYSSQDAQVQFPVRINGPVCLLGKLNFCTEYPGNTLARDSYLSGLNSRRLAGLSDYRPFPTAISIKGVVGTQDTATMTTMTTNLGMVLTEPLVTYAPPSHPGSIYTYKLYPGGKSYDVKRLQDFGNPISNVTVAPNPATNPLGIYRTDGSLSIGSNVQLTGTIITEDSGGADILVTGTNVAFKPFNMPAIYGSSETYQLPTMITRAAVRMNSGSDAKIDGTAVVGKEFEIKQGTTATKFALTGSLITDTLQLRGRTTWIMSPATWNSDRNLFLLQLVGVNPKLYFPDFEESLRGLAVKPTLTFSSDSSGVKPHWHIWSEPIYQADPADPGLKWEIVRWEDGS
jgi:hypothetical protein